MPKSGETTRKQILAAAHQIVHERGVEHLTLELTAQEASVSKGGLLYHFPSKDALIKGMIEDYLRRFTEDFSAAANQEPPDTPGRWTRAYLHTTYYDNQTNPRMSTGMLAAAATNPALLAPLQQSFGEWVRLLEQDGIDPVLAMIIRLAIDGLWMVELFGLAEPEPRMRAAILEALNGLIDRKLTPSGFPGSQK